VRGSSLIYAGDALLTVREFEARTVALSAPQAAPRGAVGRSMGQPYHSRRNPKKPGKAVIR
jgi:hypothetical protein